MAEDLRPEGLSVYLGDVVITTPGLAGRVEVYAAGTDGMRGAEDSSEQFRQALDDSGVTEQLTVEISQHSELDASGGTRGAGGGADITLEVPAPGEGNGQLILYAAEDGSLSWHLPDDVPPDQVATRGGERRTYHLPREVILAEPSADGAGQRGILGAVGTKLFKVLVFPLIDPVLQKVGDFFARRWEDKHRRNQVRWFGVDDFQRADVAAFAAPDWVKVEGGPSLLFIHGTTAQSNTAFDQLPKETLAELSKRYGGRIFALDHFTISVTPDANVDFLRSQLVALADQSGPGPLILDIVSHSRGGLVGRVLAEKAAALGLDKQISVRTLVMVGTPNAGTALADKEHLSQLLDRITDLAQFIPDAGVTDVVGLVLAILKQLSVGAYGGLEGVMSMNPQGDYLTQFNVTPGSSATYRAIASNYEPPSGAALARIARNRGTDFVFGSTGNDLVVPTNGVFEVEGATGFPIADPLVFTTSQGVDHGSYFGRPEVSVKLLEWLPG
ncbi:alpha/beta hydrolase [Lapillicoccus sp.]|uniref:esterase/lipase family protein n=1 Tax=Lapillicoccus sp. TaxID=1909287 RepID=UPI003265A473